MTEEDKHDMQMGRAVRLFTRWWGASLLICFVFVCFLGEHSLYQNWVLAGSLTGGAVIAWLLGRADKRRRESTLQSKNDVVE